MTESRKSKKKAKQMYLKYKLGLKIRKAL